MDFTLILKNISKHIQFEKEEADYFVSLLSRREVKRKESILKDGDKCTVINYVQEGTLRAYYQDKEGNENIIMFALNDWWVTDMYSFISEQPAMLNIDALEESIIIQLKKEDLEVPATKNF